MSTIGKSYYDNMADLQNSSNYSARKVVANAGKDDEAQSIVVNQGDTKAFEKASEGMGKDQFLSLLVAQLQYQDPLEPAKDTQFVAQLAQFSQLEFTQNSSKAISQLAENMQAFMDMQTLQAQSITNASATPLIGKEVRVMENTFEYAGLSSRDFNVHLQEGHSSGTLIIRDADGKTVAEIALSAENKKGNDLNVTWDGVDKDTGKRFPFGGKFTTEVVSPSGSAIAGYCYQEGRVEGVSFSANGSALNIGDKKYGLGYLVNVKDA